MNCANPCMDWISGWSHKRTVSALGDFCWLVGGCGWVVKLVVLCWVLCTMLLPVILRMQYPKRAMTLTTMRTDHYSTYMRIAKPRMMVSGSHDRMFCVTYYSLNSLKGAIQGIIPGEYYGGSEAR